MPSLGADMDAGRLLEWHVGVGDQVKRGDIVATVDTNKAHIEIEVFEDGVVTELLAEPGDKVAVGNAIARIDGAAAGTDATERSAPVPAGVEAPGAETPPAPSPEPPPPPVLPGPERGPEPAPHEHHIRVTPLARRVAERLNVDLTQVEGTGNRGAVLRADVERAAGPAPAPPRSPAETPPATPSEAPTREDRQRAMRDAIAALMARSKREIPHYYLTAEIDMTAGTEWLTAENARRSVASRLLMPVLLVKAVALAAREVPEMNGFWREDHFEQSAAVHIGMAISLRGGGLIAPALHDADRTPLDDLMRALQDLVKRTRSGGLRASEMSDPTITVTSLGDQGVDEVLGVIYPPQVALVGFGRVTDRPRAADGMIGVRPCVSATLAADHRASDGHGGALFLRAVDRLLQHPDKL